MSNRNSRTTRDERRDRDGRRERRAADETREPRERESRESSWSEWIWSNEYKAHYRHRIGLNGQSECDIDRASGPSPASGYPAASNTPSTQPWGTAPPSNRDWDRPVQTGPSQWGPDMHSNSPQPQGQAYPPREMGPPARPVARDTPYRPLSGDGQGRDSAVLVTRGQEYFILGAGIDREVITADICRYLGNDALVKPGTYKNPKNGENQRGYFITAFTPLTKENTADLKADTARWHSERRRGDTYISSSVHESRVHWGPTNAYGGPTASGPPILSPTPNDMNPSPSTGYSTATPAAVFSGTRDPRASSATTGYTSTGAGTAYAYPQNYTTTGGSNFYPGSDIHTPTSQPAAHDRQTGGHSQGFEPRTYFDSNAQSATKNPSQATVDYSPAVEGSHSPYSSAAAHTQTSASTFGQAAASSSTRTATRTNPPKRQRSHETDQMDFMDED